MHIAVVGFGTMGHVVRDLALREGHEVVAVIDPHAGSPEVTASTLSVESLANADVAIEFSVP